MSGVGKGVEGYACAGVGEGRISGAESREGLAELTVQDGEWVRPLSVHHVEGSSVKAVV